jgi:aspartyl-tRNA(Asn)/glutamyl-tRNA(Gln) amidotransferase subunit A
MAHMLERRAREVSLRGLARRLAARDISATELLEATLADIHTRDPLFGAFLTVFDHSLDSARARERKGFPGPLHGIPISLKDIVLTKDGPTTAGSRTFGRGIETPTDAPVVRRLRRAGAIIVGKTNLHEIAMGVTTVNEHFGPARNPWDRERIAGGSSGGSAVAVAMGMGFGSVGTDTRGSIRIPAACCGITGLKPTRGLVPTEGVVPLSWALDHVGPMTRSVEDAALMLGVMAGRKALLRKLLAAVDDAPPRYTVGICDYYFRDVDPEIERSVRAAVAVLEASGFRVRPVAIPQLEGAHKASTVITLAEALTFHDERLRSDPAGFGPLIRDRLQPGYALTAVDLVRAERTRLEAVSAMTRAFREVDCLAAPTIPAFPHRIGEQSVTIGGKEARTVESFTRLNSPQNMAGVPALALPCGFSSRGLPIGLQLIAGAGRDDVVLAVGAAYQRETDWHLRQPD